MRNIFSLDSKFMIALNTIADYVILNILFLITCIPVFTIGSAKTALYRVMFDMIDDRGSHYKRYFSTFFHEFTTVTPLCLLKDGVLAVFCWIALITYANPVPFKGFVLVVLGIVAGLWSLVFSNLYPQVAVFTSTRKEYLKNSVFIAFSKFPLCLLTMVFDLLPVVLFLLNLNIFMLVLPIWGFFYFSVTTNLAARMWRKPFDQYIEAFEKAQSE